MTAPCQTTPSGAIFPGNPGESLEQYVARSVASFEACMDAGLISDDIDIGGGNADLQRQYPETGSTS